MAKTAIYSKNLRIRPERSGLALTGTDLTQLLFDVSNNRYSRLFTRAGNVTQRLMIMRCKWCVNGGRRRSTKIMIIHTDWIISLFSRFQSNCTKSNWERVLHRIIQRLSNLSLFLATRIVIIKQSSRIFVIIKF